MFFKLCALLHFSTSRADSGGDPPGLRQEHSIPSRTVVELGSEMHKPSEQGTTIVYVPTRKETIKIAEFLCKFGVKAAAYHAMVCVTYCITKKSPSLCFHMFKHKHNIYEFLTPISFYGNVYSCQKVI